MTRVAGPILFLHSRKPHAEYFSAIMGGWHEACLLAPLRLGRAVWLASGQVPSREARQQLRALASLQVRKRTNGQPRWTRWVFAPRTLMLVWLAGRLYRSYRSRIEALQPRALVVWNGEKYYQAIAVRVAQDLGVTVLRFENGVLPDTTTLDRRGINADNSVPRDAAFYRSQADAPDWIPPALDTPPAPARQAARLHHSGAAGALPAGALPDRRRHPDPEPLALGPGHAALLPGHRRGPRGLRES